MHLRLTFAFAMSFVMFPLLAGLYAVVVQPVAAPVACALAQGGPHTPALTLPPATSTQGQYLQGLQRWAVSRRSRSNTGRGARATRRPPPEGQPCSGNTPVSPAVARG